MGISVLIIDDSAVVRKVLTELLNKSIGIEVIDSASDPIFALKKIQKQKPDVIVLDIEMPRMDGLTFLKKIMQENPIPVVMCSNLTKENSRTSIKALSLGAVDVVAKPKMDLNNALGEDEKKIINAVRAAAKVNLSHHKRFLHSVKPAQKKLSSQLIFSKNKVSSDKNTQQIVAIGTSTGGTLALEAVLPHLSSSCLGMVIVQHMPEHFTAAFAERLNGISNIEVKEGVNGDKIYRGRAIIAPGNKHMLVRKNSKGEAFIELKDGPPVSRHRPSVDVLFRSVAKSFGKNALGIIMTGMGSDGVSGLTEMKSSGALTFAQDEASCVVYGMPSVAIKKGAASEHIELTKMPALIEYYS